MANTLTAATSDDVLRIAVGLDDLRRRLKAEAKAGNYEGVMAIYASMRGLELDVMSLTTLAGKLATDLVMR
jgi:hypothetical protein